MAGTSPRIRALHDPAGSIGLPPVRKWRRRLDNRHSAWATAGRYSEPLPCVVTPEGPLHPHSCHTPACIVSTLL